MKSIRRAQTIEAPILTQIALAAKRHWGYPENWIDAWREDLTITAEFVQYHEVFAAVVNDTLIGFYALVKCEERTVLDHLWVLPEWIGKGIGRQLLIHALKRASANGARQIEIVSDPNAEGFYRKAGARKIGEVLSAIEGQDRRLPRLAMDTSTTGDALP